MFRRVLALARAHSRARDHDLTLAPTPPPTRLSYTNATRPQRGGLAGRCADEIEWTAAHESLNGSPQAVCRHCAYVHHVEDHAHARAHELSPTAGQEPQVHRAAMRMPLRSCRLPWLLEVCQPADRIVVLVEVVRALLPGVIHVRGGGAVAGCARGRRRARGVASVGLVVVPLGAHPPRRGAALSVSECSRRAPVHTPHCTALATNDLVLFEFVLPSLGRKRASVR